jgi:hypothetical protein
MFVESHLFNVTVFTEKTSFIFYRAGIYFEGKEQDREKERTREKGERVRD